MAETGNHFDAPASKRSFAACPEAIAFFESNTALTSMPHRSYRITMPKVGRTDRRPIHRGTACEGDHPGAEVRLPTPATARDYGGGDDDRLLEDLPHFLNATRSLRSAMHVAASWRAMEWMWCATVGRCG
jgi:hypothetical protein